MKIKRKSNNMENNTTPINSLYGQVQAILSGKGEIDVDKTIAELKHAAENVELARNFIKVVFVNKSVNNGADSALVANNFFSTDLNLRLFDTLPEDLQYLVQGLWDCGTDEMTYAISNLKERKSLLISAIAQIECNRDKNAAGEKTKTVWDIQKVLPISSKDVISLHNSQILVTALDRPEQDMGYSPTQEHKENQKADLEQMKTIHGLNPDAENVLETFQKTQECSQNNQQNYESSQKVSAETSVDYGNLISERNTLLKKNEDAQKENQQLRDEMATERQTSKIILKKIRKEREVLAKKLKRQTEQAELDKKHSLEKLAGSATNDEKLHVVVPPSGEPSKTSVQALQQLVDAKSNRTTNSRSQSDDLQKRYEDVCQQLETAEKSLEVQQELNAKITKVAAENRTRHSYEISDLQDFIHKLKIKSTKQNEELQRIKELERRKTDVLVNVLEDEKQRIRDECDAVKIQLEGAQKALKDQKTEAKRQLEAEQWKWKKLVRAAQKRGTESLDSSKSQVFGGKIDQEGNQSESNAAENNKLEKQIINDLRGKLLLLESELTEKSAKAEAFEELVSALDQKDQQLRTEREKFEALQREVSESLEKEEASERRAQSLDQQEIKLEAKRVEYETASKDWMDRISKSDKEKSKLQATLNDLNKQLSLKIEELGKIESEKCHFQKEAELNAKKLEESLSPRKDKATQLESRLEVIQGAAKAQQKRLEDDLSKTRAELDEFSSRNLNLVEQINMLQEKSKLASELASSPSDENEDLVSRLRKSLSELQEENNTLKSDNAKERTVLVDELIVTKNKLKELMKSSSTEESHTTKIQKLEEKLKSAEISLTECQNRAATPVALEQVSPPKPIALDELFPYLDPVFRQFIELLLQNQNYMYGVFGLFIYGFLVHLYLIL